MALFPLTWGMPARPPSQGAQHEIWERWRQGLTGHGWELLQGYPRRQQLTSEIEALYPVVRRRGGLSVATAHDHIPIGEQLPAACSTAAAWWKPRHKVQSSLFVLCIPFRGFRCSQPTADQNNWLENSRKKAIYKLVITFIVMFVIMILLLVISGALCIHVLHL